MIITVIVLAKLLEKQSDIFGYITYVFELLEKEDVDSLQSKYIMCIRYPNWNHGVIKKGEVGYLKVNEVKAGLDKWFDGKDFVPYKNDDIQFIKFIKVREECEDECVL